MPACLLACLPVFLLPPSRRRRSSPSAVALARSYPTPRLPPYPSCVPAPAHPHKKPKSSVGATGGFSLRLLLPSSHHSSFTSPLTFPPVPHPSAPARRSLSSATAPPFSSVPLASRLIVRAIPSCARLFVPESIAPSRSVVHPEVVSRSRPPEAPRSDSQPSSCEDDFTTLLRFSYFSG